MDWASGAKERGLAAITSRLVVYTNEWMLSFTEMVNTERGPEFSGSQF